MQVGEGNLKASYRTKGLLRMRETLLFSPKPRKEYFLSRKGICVRPHVALSSSHVSAPWAVKPSAGKWGPVDSIGSFLWLENCSSLFSPSHVWFRWSQPRLFPSDTLGSSGFCALWTALELRMSPFVDSSGCSSNSGVLPGRDVSCGSIAFLFSSGFSRL